MKMIIVKGRFLESRAITLFRVFENHESNFKEVVSLFESVRSTRIQPRLLLLMLDTINKRKDKLVTHKRNATEAVGKIGPQRAIAIGDDKLTEYVLDNMF